MMRPYVPTSHDAVAARSRRRIHTFGPILAILLVSSLEHIDAFSSSRISRRRATLWQDRAVPSGIQIRQQEQGNKKKISAAGWMATTSVETAAVSSSSLNEIQDDTNLLQDARIELQDMAQTVQFLLTQQQPPNFPAAYQTLQQMVQRIRFVSDRQQQPTTSTNTNATTTTRTTTTTTTTLSMLGPLLDGAFQTFTTAAFTQDQQAQQPNGAVRRQIQKNPKFRQHQEQRLMLGVQAIYLQLSLGRQDAHRNATTTSETRRSTWYPYNTVPRRTFSLALQALTRWNEAAASRQEEFLLPKQQQQLATSSSSTWTDESIQQVLQGEKSDSGNFNTATLSPSSLAFRMLQRLITGVGVRPTSIVSSASLTTAPSTSNSSPRVYEKEINRVLNLYSNAGQMHICHRIVALQQRAVSTPPLSLTGYSILFKGYGKLQNLHHVNLLLRHARHNPALTVNGGGPDVIFMNSLLHAYVQCQAWKEAEETLEQMRRGGIRQQQQQDDLVDESKDDFVSWFPQIPPPNKRSYNTMLKGLALQAKQEQLSVSLSSQQEKEDETDEASSSPSSLLAQALKLFQEMQLSNQWDAISINTLVQVALAVHCFDLAQDLLHEYTVASFDNGMVSSPKSKGKRREKQHPNTEAYTQLLDYHAKAGRLAESLQVYATMRQRGVKPNQVTYTCLISGLARHGKVDEAYQLLDIMGNTTSPPSVVTYNAFLSALLSNSNTTTSATTNNKNYPDQTSLTMEKIPDATVEEALKILRFMIRSGVKPNAVTVSTVVSALGRCDSSPRVQDAILLVDKLERQNLLVAGRHYARVVTALVRTCAWGNDIRSVILSFRRFNKNSMEPDLIAVNAFLDACCRCDRGDLAMESYRYYFEPKKDAEGSSVAKQEQPPRLQADLITYSTLITHLLQSSGSSNNKIQQASQRKMARNLYASMKRRGISPDTGLIDSILRPMLAWARQQTLMRLPRADVLFITSVMRHASNVHIRDQWGPGQLERRKRAVRAVLSDRLQELRKEGVDESLLSLGRSSFGSSDNAMGQSKNDEDSNDLFRRKGWNEIDSGFRLWSSLDDSSSNSPSSSESSFFQKADDDVDEFLQSKGWNNVDSGFRIF